ncbi:MAG: DUF2934 domain-containing protein [Ideonella sp.]|nr:DUF2934 domain-containing protein [Ideonella sp.]
MSKLPQAQSSPATDETRTLAGSNYGDVKPSGGDPSRGAEMERDALPHDADFSRPLQPGGNSPDPGSTPGEDRAPGTAAADTSREERIRQAAHARYQQRGGIGGDAVQDWIEAEAEIDRRQP